MDGDEPVTTNSNVSYHIISIQPQALSAKFTMRNPYSGVIRVASPVDFESLASSIITLTVRATDGGAGSRSSTARVKITVVDINDHHPVFTRPKDVAGVKENATVGMPRQG